MPKKKITTEKTHQLNTSLPIKLVEAVHNYTADENNLLSGNSELVKNALVEYFNKREIKIADWANKK